MTAVADSTVSSSGERSESASAPVTLDDSAALLVMLDAHDRRAVWRVSKALENAAGEDERTTSAFRAVAALLADAIGASEKTLGEAIDAGGRLIEAAATSSESAARSETPARPAAIETTVANAPVSAADELPADADVSLLGDFVAESRD